MTTPMQALTKVWAEHCEGVIQLTPPVAELVQSIVEPREKRTVRPGWKEKQAKMLRFYYVLYVTEVTKKGKELKKPYVTICLLVDPESKTVSRGVAVCHPKDVPNNKTGRQKANAWAEKAMYHQTDAVASPQEEKVMERLMEAVGQCDDEELKAHFMDFPEFPTFGFYLASGTDKVAEFERPTKKELALMMRGTLAREGQLENMAPLVALFDLLAGNIGGEEVDQMLEAWKAKTQQSE